MWAPDQRFIVSSERDGVIKTGSRVLAASRSIPIANVFSFEQLMNCYETPGADRPLRSVCARSRLDLIGHATSSNFEGHSPNQLAMLLHSGGLLRVGVIKLQGCNTGLGTYLEDLLTELTRRRIEIGYLAGMKGPQSDMRFAINLFGKDRTFRSIPFLPQKWVGDRPEYFGIRTIRGNMQCQFSGTRYDLS